MSSLFCFGKTNVQKKESTVNEKGIIGRFYENDFPVIIKFVNELPVEERVNSLPFLAIVSWEYDGSTNNSMPPENVNKRMIDLEEALSHSMEKTNIFTHAYSRTGNNLKELVYYTAEQEHFMTMINKALEEHDVYPIEVSFYEDKEWSEFKRILNMYKD